MEKAENTLGTQIQHDSGLSVQVTMAIRDFLQPSMGLNTGLWAPLFQFMSKPHPLSRLEQAIIYRPGSTPTLAITELHHTHRRLLIPMGRLSPQLKR